MTGTGHTGNGRIFSRFIGNGKKAVDKSGFIGKRNRQAGNFVSGVIQFLIPYHSDIGFFKFFETICPEFMKIFRHTSTLPDLFRFDCGSAQSGQITGIHPFGNFIICKSIIRGFDQNKSGVIKRHRESKRITLGKIDRKSFFHNFQTVAHCQSEFAGTHQFSFAFPRSNFESDFFTGTVNFFFRGHNINGRRPEKSENKQYRK